MTKLKTGQKTWGEWTLSPSTYELSYKNGRYYVDLERCTDSGQVLDWIQQVAGKTFAHQDPGCIFDLVCALKDLLEIPKGYCEWGMTREGKTDVRKLVDGFDRRQDELNKFMEKRKINQSIELPDAS